MTRILFVCTANTCRSPLAEYLLRHHAEKQKLELEIRSAGIYASPGSSISQHSGHILQERSIQLQFASSSITSELMEWADLILTMTLGHKAELMHRYPNQQEKLFTLKEYVRYDEHVLESLRELDSLYAEFEMQAAIGNSLSKEQLDRLRELERGLPPLDIVDPFAGSLDMYRQCAIDIEQHLLLLIDKLKKERLK